MDVYLHTRELFIGLYFSDAVYVLNSTHQKLLVSVIAGKAEVYLIGTDLKKMWINEQFTNKKIISRDVRKNYDPNNKKTCLDNFEFIC